MGHRARQPASLDRSAVTRARLVAEVRLFVHVCRGVGREGAGCTPAAGAGDAE